MAFTQQGGYFSFGAPMGFDNLSRDPGAMASVLQDIMPILAGLQSRSARSSGPWTAGQASPETVAAVALVADLGADNVRRLTAYLDEESSRHDGLDNCVPLVAAAAQALAAYDYAQAFTLIFDCYRTIAMLRVANPTMPMPSSTKRLATEGRPAQDRRSDDAEDRDASRRTTN